ncbi:DUF87 domain-containing protein, partial [Candidatus Woesearchaeota archaeon]|nr:DUF87 domain-containing protein [Candidatus Woesearchaeota archaeon]
FYKPNSSTQIVNINSLSDGTYTYPSLHKRSYDVMIETLKYNANAYNVTINLKDYDITGWDDDLEIEHVSIQDVSVTQGDNDIIAVAVETPITNISGNITFVFDRAGRGIKDINRVYIYTCSDWDFAGVVCNTNFTRLTSTRKIRIDGLDSFTADITGFSAFLVSEYQPQSASVEDIPSSPSGGGGGGGGGVTEEELAQQLEFLKSDTLSVDTAEINKELYNSESARGKLQLFNDQNETLLIEIEISEEISEFIKFELDIISLEQGKEIDIFYDITIPDNTRSGVYSGEVILKSSIGDKRIPVTLRINEKAEQLLNVDLNPLTPSISPGRNLDMQLIINNPLDRTVLVNISLALRNIAFETILEQKYAVNITPDGFIEDYAFSIPTDFRLGEYDILANINYMIGTRDYNVKSREPVFITEPFMQIMFLGLRVWVWITLLSLAGLLAFSYYEFRKYFESKKKYHIAMPDLHQLPRPGPRSAWVGTLAESKIRTFIDLEKLMMHTIVAGSTGGGKTIGAQVIIEEALKKGVGVVVFDPTAQWSGFLRKLEDEKMLNMYQGFGMARTDAKAFNGNIRQITNPREVIDLKRYIKPGEIHIFTINKLDPKDIDVFVANTVREIFHANLEESQELKTLIVYDEVHRLLSKFGGSGEGFIQVERACREFRKWGIGLLLISQVLSDFIGEIKANINTEIQMRTRDEGDLDRIKNKYGEEILKSVVKASVGIGMLENAEYNKGKPYLVNFRPILHNIRRLSDDDLDKYNKYNELIDDLSYQIKELEKEGQDIFDLELELNLALKKLKSGAFNMVDIYLESLKPRIEGIWTKLGVEVRHRKIELIDEELIKKSVESAKESREEYEKEQKEEEEEQKEIEEEKVKEEDAQLDEVVKQRVQEAKERDEETEEVEKYLKEETEKKTKKEEKKEEKPKEHKKEVKKEKKESEKEEKHKEEKHKEEKPEKKEEHKKEVKKEDSRSPLEKIKDYYQEVADLISETEKKKGPIPVEKSRLKIIRQDVELAGGATKQKEIAKLRKDLKSLEEDVKTQY